jgi:hypothetical protein
VIYAARTAWTRPATRWRWPCATTRTMPWRTRTWAISTPAWPAVLCAVAARAATAPPQAQAVHTGRCAAARSQVIPLAGGQPPPTDEHHQHRWLAGAPCAAPPAGRLPAFSFVCLSSIPMFSRRKVALTLAALR